MPNLTQIASTIRTLAQLNLKRPPTRAYKTGNLFRTIGSANRADSMVRRVGGQPKYGKRIEIELDYAPRGAEYGKFVNDGTVKMEARPFADNAINDPIVTKLIMDYVENTLTDEIIKPITTAIQKL